MDFGKKTVEIAGLCLLFLVAFTLLSLVTYSPSTDPPTTTATNINNAAGQLGAYLSYYLVTYLGYLSWIFVIYPFVVSIDFFRNRFRNIKFRPVCAWILVGLGTGGLLSYWHQQAAGVMGMYLYDRLIPIFGIWGSALLFAFCLVLGLSIGTVRSVTDVFSETFSYVNKSLGSFEKLTRKWYSTFKKPINGLMTGVNWLKTIGRPALNIGGSSQSTATEPTRNSSDSSNSSTPSPTSADKSEDESDDSDSQSESASEDSNVIPFDQDDSDEDSRSDLDQGAENDDQAKPVEVERERPEVKEADMSKYTFPSLNLLNQGNIEDTVPDDEDLELRANQLEETFDEFGLDAEVVGVNPGPVLTMYEVEPGPGVSVKKFRSRVDDIKLNLAVESVRIVSPIPGKSAIGIEVPNPDRAIVKLRDVLESSEFQDQNRALPLALGLDVHGNVMVDDLAQSDMTHLLVAGATGSGKSVCLNAIICSLLYKLRPDELKFLMIDPKRVELKLYDGLPHLMTPVLDDASEATKIFKWAVREMENRYEKLEEAGVRDIESYNEQATEDDKLPYLVIVVDEMADLMMTNPKECETAIVRLAQKARATGIHMILATQRPDKDVITGLIKANMPARISFRVTNKTNSRIILDQNGAETLLGNGDLLYMSGRTKNPKRAQGSFISDGETKELIKSIKEQLKPSYVEKEDLFGSSSGGNFEETMDDEHYEDAKKLVVERQKASASMLQRRFRVGYNRAARMIDAMEEEGVVGPHRGSKARNVLVEPDEFFDENGETS